MSSVAFANCFDFKAKIIKPLHGESALKANDDVKDFGKADKNLTWALTRGEVKKPIQSVLSLLLNHNTTKSPRFHDLDVVTLQDSNYLSRHYVKFKIKPFLFITVEWEEEWGYALADGTPSEPKEIVISYEKVEGTSHIEHLCGSMVLRKLTASSTDVFMYEEAKATQRTATDTMNGVYGTLETLRK